MIVVAIIAILASAALPNLLAARVSSDESAAIATLRHIYNAQSVVQTSAVIDQDGDGQGEFAWLAEMAGFVQVRDPSGPHGGPVMMPSSLAKSLGRVDPNGLVSKTGYVYRLVLPSAGGSPLVEAGNGGSPTGEDCDLCETNWLCYGWPSSFATSGRRAFAINQNGEFVQTDNVGAGGNYEGSTNVPAADAAIEVGSAGSILGKFSLRGVPAAAVDGKTWKPLN
jgi:type II secretory pathway pseudopilin PulG